MACPSVDFEIYGDTPLPRVAGQEVGAVRADEERRDVPAGVTAERLDFDHIRAQGRQYLGAERAGQERRQVEYPDPGQRAGAD